MIDDATLLRRYAAERAEDAFAEVVRRNLPFVYSAALRRLGGDAHRAQDVAQVVFCALARDAGRIARDPALAGWFYTATRNAAIDALRSEQRRRHREEEAHTMQQTANEPAASADWSQLRPVLDSAMDQLTARDREAVLLRFFQGRPFAEIGTAIGLSEEAARKRVERALDKLRELLRPRGIASTSGALAALLEGQTVSAAPTGLAASVTGTALVAGGATAIGTAAFLTMTKLQIGLAAAIVVGGAVGLVMQQRTISSLRENIADTQQHAAELVNENVALAKTRTNADAELAQLRTEVAALKSAVRAPSPAAASTIALPLPVGDRAVPPKPAVDDAARQETKAKLHRRYDPFLQKFGLTEAQADRFVELKLAIYEAQDDLQGAIRQAGTQGHSGDVEAMRAKLVTPMWDEIRQLLGEEGYRAYADYEKTSFYRAAYLERLNPLLVSAGAPLNAEQEDQLVRILAANNHPYQAQPTDIGNRTRIDWDAVVSQSQGMLTPAQFASLQTYANQRKATKK